MARRSHNSKARKKSHRYIKTLEGRAREIPRSKARWRFASIKERRMIHCESPLERDLCHFLEFDPRVRRYQEQALAIDYIFKGEEHQYFIDFLVELINGSKRLIEVKSSDEVDSEENRCKFAAAHAYAEENGMEFIVVTEKELHKGATLENMKHIYRHGAIWLRKEMVLSIIEAISQLNETNVETILVALTPVSGCHDPRSIFLWLIWRGKITVDISQKIESFTMVKVTHT